MNECCLETRFFFPHPAHTPGRRAKGVDQLRRWIAREVQVATPASSSSSLSATGGAGAGAVENDNRAGHGPIDTRLVVDVVEALLKDNDVDDQEGYCRVKKQVYKSGFARGVGQVPVLLLRVIIRV